MGQQQNRARQSTITEYLRSQFKHHAILTGILIAFISVIVLAASIQFSTDRHVRRVCNELRQSARLLVETSQLDTYRPYYDEIAGKLQKNFNIRDLQVVKNRPANSWMLYSLGHCFIEWLPNLEVVFYSPTHWAGGEIYVQGTTTPRFFRSDLIWFIFIICLALVASYYFGTRSLLRRIEKSISEPIYDVWQGLRSGKKPGNLEIKEIKDLWTSLAEYKELLLLRHRMLLAKEYYHEVKSPAYYAYNQLKRLTLHEHRDDQKKFLTDSLGRAEEMISEMEKALTKIANDDYARFPKKVNFRKIIDNRIKNVTVSGEPFVYGDKTNFKTLLKNLCDNARDACGDWSRVHVSLQQAGEIVIFKVKNPVKDGAQIDTDLIFTSGFTGKINGTGMGLSLCKHIVEMNEGSIEASYSSKEEAFEVIVKLPAAKRIQNASEK